MFFVGLHLRPMPLRTQKHSVGPLLVPYKVVLVRFCCSYFERTSPSLNSPSVHQIRILQLALLPDARIVAAFLFLSVFLKRT